MYLLKNPRKLISAFAAIIMIFVMMSSLVSVSAAYDGIMISVDIDGKEYLGSAARLIDGVTMVPLRDFSTALTITATVDWDSQLAKAKVRAEGLALTANNSENYIEANGRILYCDSQNIILENHKMYVPMRSLVKAFGGEVFWHENTHSISVLTGARPIEDADTFYNSDDLYWLSRIISAESRGEPLLGQIAVGNVVLNRVADPAFPNSVYGVVFDKKFGVQFTPAYNGAIYNTPYEISVLAAKICLDGYTLSDEMIYFYQPSASSISWFSKNCGYLFTIGCHEFYA